MSRTLVELVDTALAEAARSDGARGPDARARPGAIGYDRDITLVTDTAEPVPATEDRPRRPRWQ